MLIKLNGLLYAFFFIVILISCGKNEVGDIRLLRAEALMVSSPDSSYQILKSISPEVLSKSEQMFYGLLLAEATDKKYLSLLPCDSLLNEAIRYYSSGINRAKALMYKGRVQWGMNMYEEAMENCFAALKELGDTKEELRIKGIICEVLGNLYSHQVLIKESMKMFHLAEKCFMDCDYKKGLSLASNDIGWNYLLEGDTACARRYMKQGLTYALEQKDSAVTSVIYHNLSCTYEDMDSILFNGRQSLAFGQRLASKAAIVVGYVFINQEQLDSAEYYFKGALRDTLIETRALAFYGLKDVMEVKGEFQQALEYLNNYSSVMDSIYFHKQSSEVEKNVYEHEAKMKVYKDKVSVQILFICLAILGLLIVLSLIWRIQWAKRRKRILQLEYERDTASLKASVAELQYYIASLRKEQEYNKEQITQKECKIIKLADEKAQLCNVIFKETSIYKKVEQLSHQDKMKNKQKLCVLLEDEQKQLRSTIVEIYKDYISYLYQAYPKYTEDDCLFSCLSLCGWNDFTIALCFGNVDKQIVVQRRYRMKLKATN